MKKFIDPNIKFKKLTVDNNFQLVEFEGKKFPLPTEIEISESGTCNRKCSFCPRSTPGFVDKKEFISNTLFNKLCDELMSYNYAGTIRFSGFVEPLIDKNIFNLIKNARKKLPSLNIELVTNGDPLNFKRLKKLFESGLNKILISVYDSEEDYFKFVKLCQDCGLNERQFIVRKRYLSKKENFGISLSNRAGMMAKAEYKIHSAKEPLNNPCFIPCYTFFLDYQGDALICPHDWGKKLILGNLNFQSLKEIWFSKKSMKIRSLLNQANRNFTPCNVCDVDGTLMGEKISKFFK